MSYRILFLSAEYGEDFTAIGTMALAVISFLAIGVQIYWNRKVLKESRDTALSQINLLQNQLKAENENSFKYSSVKLAQIFEAQFQDLTETRMESATLILQHKYLDQDSIDYVPIKEKMDDIFDFFDTIGYFVRHMYMKAEVGHQYFDYWFTPYYQFFQLYHIKALSGYEESVRNNLASLSQAFERVEIDQTGHSREPISKNQLKEFSQQEESQ